MEVVKINPSLSFFQLSLLNAKHSGVLSEEAVKRMRDDGVVLVQKTADRFFSAASREITYLHALRMVDCILSFAMAGKKYDAHILQMKTLRELFQEGLLELRSIDNLPADTIFPKVGLPDDLLSDIKQSVSRISFKTNDKVSDLLKTRTAREELAVTHELTEHIVRCRHPEYGKETTREFKARNKNVISDCNEILYSYLFAVIHGHEQLGYEISASVIVTMTKKKRPTTAQAQKVLEECVKNIPLHLQTEFISSVKRFLKNRIIRSYLTGKLKVAEKLYLGPGCPLYCYGESIDRGHFLEDQ